MLIRHFILTAVHLVDAHHSTTVPLASTDVHYKQSHVSRDRPRSKIVGLQQAEAPPSSHTDTLPRLQTPPFLQPTQHRFKTHAAVAAVAAGIHTLPVPPGVVASDLTAHSSFDSSQSLTVRHVKTAMHLVMHK